MLCRVPRTVQGATQVAEQGSLHLGVRGIWGQAGASAGAAVVNASCQGRLCFVYLLSVEILLNLLMLGSLCPGAPVVLDLAGEGRVFQIDSCRSHAGALELGQSQEAQGAALWPSAPSSSPLTETRIESRAARGLFCVPRGGEAGDEMQGACVLWKGKPRFTICLGAA